MAIDERDFYASHGLDFDYKNMMDEYIKAVIKQAKIEVLTELQSEIEECVDGAEGSPQFEQGVATAREQVVKMIQQQINELDVEHDPTPQN